MASYLRYHRKSSGLTQRELAELIGSIGPRQIARLENHDATPTFLVAVGCHRVFGVAIEELFPGHFETIGANVVQQMAAMEQRLHESTAKGRKAAEIARKLEWFQQRRNPEMV